MGLSRSGISVKGSGGVLVDSSGNENEGVIHGRVGVQVGFRRSHI